MNTCKESEVNRNKMEAFVFVSPECPISEAILLNLKQLDSAYSDSVLSIKLVVPGKLYSDIEIDSFRRVNNLQFELIKDSNAVLVKRFGASITPEVFLIKDKELLYSGAIDDRALDNDIIRQSAKKFYLRDAIDLTLRNKKISLKKTEAIGCYIEL